MAFKLIVIYRSMTVYLLKKSAYKWTRTVQTQVVQWSTLKIFLSDPRYNGSIATLDQIILNQESILLWTLEAKASPWFYPYPSCRQ